jgi:hypothetical protein
MTGKLKEGCRRTDITGRPRIAQEKQMLEIVSWYVSERFFFSGGTQPKQGDLRPAESRRAETNIKL